MARIIALTGISGKTYQYELCDVNALWKPVPGNYVFLDLYGSPKYIGETENFATRHPGPAHERWGDAQRYGAVAVYAHHNAWGEVARKAEEADLIRAYNPPCNTQHKLANPLEGGLFGPGRRANRKSLLSGW